MQAAILTIGDEILLGQITDTNSAYIARELARLGIPTRNILSISDNASAITQALDTLLHNHELVIITGGLGPTKDDLTKKVLTDYFNDRLVFHAEAFKQIERLICDRGFSMNPLNRAQAMLPASAEILPNLKGTAAGMWFEKDGKSVISLPGVPFEMEHLMQNQVLPRLGERFPELLLAYRMLVVYNIAESSLAEKLDAYENALPEGLGLAYLPSPGLIKLRLTANKKALLQLDKKFEELVGIISELNLVYLLTDETDGENLQSRIGTLLKEKGKTLSTAESCTGGYLSHLITSVAGSSAYYKGSVISYSNEIKEKVLGVNPEILQTQGAVSEPVVKAMAVSVREICRTDYALATSGVAGPGGGSAEKPVGTVWIALATPQDCRAELFHFSTTRERNIARAAFTALTMLLEELDKDALN